MDNLKVFLLVFALINICDANIVLQDHSPPPLKIPPGRKLFPDEGKMVQRVDHFNPTDARTWKMRFLNNSQFFVPGAPIFIFLGGEWEINPQYLQSGQMYDMAQENKGYMFYIEHRNYGQSYVLKDFTSSSLKFHSVDQALADIAFFISNQKKSVPDFKNSKIVLVGGSYSATLATWARQKFPHLVDIAYASSAPLRAKEDFYEYLEVVGHNIQLNSFTCWNTIRDGIAEVEERLKSLVGTQEVSTIFGTCKTLNTVEPHRSLFFYSIASVWMGIVQYARPDDIKRECNILLNFNGSAIEKLGKFTQSKVNGCLGDYNEFISFYIPTKLSTNPYRQWMYQTCTEFGFFQTSSSQNQPFGRNVKVDLFHRICRDVFSREFTPEMIRDGIKKTNIIYGELSPMISRVVSVHGSVDPWHRLGLIQNIEPKSLSIFVPGSAHCMDLSSESPDDLPALLKAKRSVKKIIKEWLQLP